MTELRYFLNQLLQTYHQKRYLSSDPLEFAHRYQDPWDREAVGLVSALLAYGNVKQIRRSIADLMIRMDQLAPSPQTFVRQLQNRGFRERAGKTLDTFVHRFNRGPDILLIYRLLGRSWKEFGSLGEHFLSHMEADDADIGTALDRLIRDWKRWAGGGTGRGFNYLLASPSSGSCCKRWCMFLRWMVRKDQLDLGLWSETGAFGAGKGRRVGPEQLVIPLDTHTGRISQYLGLTSRKSLNWLAALEVTHRLRSVDPDDPTRYDFALSRLGILDLCMKKYRKEVCHQCQLLPVCHFAARSLPDVSPSMQRSH